MNPRIAPFGSPSEIAAPELDAPAPLDQAPLAYENAAFLDSSEGRSIRILAEYTEPMARFRKQRIEDTVVFFGSARFRSLEAATAALDQTEQSSSATMPAHTRAALDMARFYEDARSLARMHAAWALTLPGPRHRFVVTSGGGPGIMEAANRGAWEAGARTIGLNITLPFEQRPNPYITPELSFNFHYFFMRKFWFASLAKALVIFPGGFGTLDEAFELLTLAQTGKLAKQITILLYGRAYWQSVLNLEAMAAHGVIAPRDLALFQFADTPDEAFTLLQHGLLEHCAPSRDPGSTTVPDEPALSPQQMLGPDIAHSR